MNTKFFTLFLLLFICSQQGIGQNFKKFKVGVGLGRSLSAAGNVKGGVILFLQPAYRINDRFQLGVRFESTKMYSEKFENNGKSYSRYLFVRSATLNGQYYFNDKQLLRPFVGMGLGYYHPFMTEYKGRNSNNLTKSNGGNRFGFYPRAGFDYGHFTFFLDANFIPGKSTYFDHTDACNNSYFSLHIGGNFGGGKK